VPPEQFGITDSLLWGPGSTDSDVDLVVYGSAAASRVLAGLPVLFDQPDFKGKGLVRMENKMNNKYTVLRWIARILGMAAFLVWGSFFLAHLSEWFGSSAGEHPPAGVWIRMVLHACMVLSFLVMLRWELAGGIISLVCTAAFFLSIQVYVPMILTLIPGICAIIAGIKNQKSCSKG
jgi:hypothetical protein